jgi:hypothetical protein
MINRQLVECGATVLAVGQAMLIRQTVCRGDSGVPPSTARRSTSCQPRPAAPHPVSRDQQLHILSAATSSSTSCQPRPAAPHPVSRDQQLHILSVATSSSTCCWPRPAAPHPVSRDQQLHILSAAMEAAPPQRQAAHSSGTRGGVSSSTTAPASTMGHGLPKPRPVRHVRAGRKRWYRRCQHAQRPPHRLPDRQGRQLRVCRSPVCSAASSDADAS